jgi:excisionase family DNA binding protein
MMEVRMSDSIKSGLLPTLYTIAEVAHHCKVSGRQVHRWIKAGQLSTHKFGRLHRIAANDLALFVTKSKKE